MATITEVLEAIGKLSEKHDRQQGEVKDDLTTIKERLATLNGHVAANNERSRENKTVLKGLPKIRQDVIVLQNAIKRHGANWLTVSGIVLAIAEPVALYFILR